MNQNNKIENSINEDEITFTNSIRSVIKYIKSNNLKILLLFFINIFVSFLILYFFFLKNTHKVSSQIDLPDSSYWEVIFSDQYQFYFFAKEDPYAVTNHYIKKNFLYILKNFKKNNNVDDSFNVRPQFKHNENDIYIKLLFESENKKLLNEFFYYFIDEINIKFNQKTTERINSFLKNQLDSTFETQIALENIIEEYELRADDFTLAQIFAYNLHSNPALIELRLKQLKEKVRNNQELMNNYKLLSPIGVNYYSESINDYTFFLIILSIFALILEIILFRLFILLNK